MLTIPKILRICISSFPVFSFCSAAAENNKNEVGEQTPVEPDPITIHMAATGDIMCHLTNVKNAYSSSTKDYDFTNVLNVSFKNFVTGLFLYTLGITNSLSLEI